MPPAARGALFEKTAPLDPPQKHFIKYQEDLPQKLFIVDLLQSQGLEFEIAKGFLDAYVKLHKGQHNISVVLGNEMGHWLSDELKERVFHGEGLIVVFHKPGQNPEWSDLLGVTIKPVTGRTKETKIQLLPNDLTPGGQAEVAKPIKIQLLKVQPGVQVVAHTLYKKNPVITYSPYGQGHVLTIAIPLQFNAGAEPVSQLLLNALTRFSQDIYTLSDLTRILPLELTLENLSPEEKTLGIKPLLPYGVNAFGFNPEPLEDDELKWNLTLPPASTSKIFYWLQLPDKIDTYRIETQLYENETKKDEVSISFDVLQTVLFRLNELIAQLRQLKARGRDTLGIRKAMHHLEKIRNRPVNSLLDHLLNLHDAVQAASQLGDVEHTDISLLRTKTIAIMVVMGRRFYDAVKTWGESQLHSLQSLLNLP